MRSGLWNEGRRRHDLTLETYFCLLYPLPYSAIVIHNASGDGNGNAAWETRIKDVLEQDAKPPHTE